MASNNDTLIRDSHKQECIKEPETKYIDLLFLELSQFTKAKTARELKLEKAVALLNSMVNCGEKHSEVSIRIVKEAWE